MTARKAVLLHIRAADLRAQSFDFIELSMPLRSAGGALGNYRDAFAIGGQSAARGDAEQREQVEGPSAKALGPQLSLPESWNCVRSMDRNAGITRLDRAAETCVTRARCMSPRRRRHFFPRDPTVPTDAEMLTYASKMDAPRRNQSPLAS